MTRARGVKSPAPGPAPTLADDVAAIAKALRKHAGRAATFGRIAGTLAEMERGAARVMRSQEAALATSGALQARCEVLQAALARSNDERDALAAQVAKQRDQLQQLRDVAPAKPKRRRQRRGT